MGGRGSWREPNVCSCGFPIPICNWLVSWIFRVLFFHSCMHHSHCTTMTGDGSLNMIWLAFEMKNTHKIKSVQCTQCDDCLSFDSHLDENQFCHLNRLNLNGSVLFNEMKSVSATNVTHTHTCWKPRSRKIFRLWWNFRLNRTASFARHQT